MNYVQHLSQAYSQTPWRKQLQGIGVVFVLLVLFLLTASVFLSITARSAVVGREIQMHHMDITAMEYHIEDMEAELARLSSAAVMEQRALAMGFRPVMHEEITYLDVPAIVTKSDGRIAVSSQPAQLDSDPVLSPDFTQTWTDWLFQNFKKPVVPLADLQP